MSPTKTITTECTVEKGIDKVQATQAWQPNRQMIEKYTKALAAEVSKAVFAATATTPMATSIKKHLGPGQMQCLR